MKFKRRQLSLKNAIGFELTIESESSFYSQLKEASDGFKRLMMGDDLYFDGPTYFTYLPSDDIQDILVFTTSMGNLITLSQPHNTSLQHSHHKGPKQHEKYLPIYILLSKFLFQSPRKE